MRQWCSKLGYSSHSALRPVPLRCLEPPAFPVNRSIFKPASDDSSPGTLRPQMLGLAFSSPCPLLRVMQAWHYAAKERSRYEGIHKLEIVKGRYKLLLMPRCYGGRPLNLEKASPSHVKEGKVKTWKP